MSDSEIDKENLVNAATKIADFLFDSTQSSAVSSWVVLRDGRLVSVRFRVYEADEITEAIEAVRKAGNP